MTQEWAPIVVAVVSGLLLVPPALIGLLGSRAEPRRLKELQALNLILKDLSKDDEGHEHLASYRSRLARAYSERAVRADPSFVVAGLLTGGWALVSFGVILNASRTGPIEQAVQAALSGVAEIVTVAGAAALAGGFALCLAVAAGFVVKVVRAWTRRPAVRRAAMRPDDADAVLANVERGS